MENWFAQGTGFWRDFSKGVRLLDSSLFQESLEDFIQALGGTFFPEGGVIPTSAEEANVTSYMLEHLRSIPSKQSNMLCGTFLFYQWVLPRLYFKKSTFSELSLDERMELLVCWSHSNFYPLRALTLSFRMLFSFGYLSDERVMEAMGFFKQHIYPNDPRQVEIREEYLKLPPEFKAKKAKEQAVHLLQVNSLQRKVV